MEWISVKYRQPEIGQIVIIGWDDNYKHTPMAIFTGVAFERYVDKMPEDRILIVTYPNVTHWMPLPEPPKNS